MIHLDQWRILIRRWGLVVRRNTALYTLPLELPFGSGFATDLDLGQTFVYEQLNIIGLSCRRTQQELRKSWCLFTNAHGVSSQTTFWEPRILHVCSLPLCALCSGWWWKLISECKYLQNIVKNLFCLPIGRLEILFHIKFNERKLRNS